MKDHFSAGCHPLLNADRAPGFRYGQSVEQHHWSDIGQQRPDAGRRPPSESLWRDKCSIIHGPVRTELLDRLLRMLEIAHHQSV